MPTNLKVESFKLLLLSKKANMTANNEMPEVVSAVEHLSELAYRMKGEEFGFKDTDISSIEFIIEALNELDSERRKCHEKLETETITSSILRHKLQFYPSEIKKEIEDAVLSARNSNVEEMEKLQKEMDQLSSNTEQLEEKHASLEKENSVLHPERDLIRQQHEEIIQQLNKRMAEKAAKQITLNETRDKLRETNQKIVDLEESIVQLKEDLIQERADARLEKKKLKKAVFETTTKTKEQREANLEQKRELDELQEQLVGSEGKLSAIRKTINKYDDSRESLEAQERSLTAKLQKKETENQHLYKRVLNLTQTLANNQEEWENQRDSMQKHIDELDAAIKHEDEKYEVLIERKLNLQVDVQEALHRRKQDAIKVGELNQQLQSAKEELGSKAEQTGVLQQENLENQEKIEQLAETHKMIHAILEPLGALPREGVVPPRDPEERPLSQRTPEEWAESRMIISSFNNQIEEYRDQLKNERKERMDLQSHKEDVTKDIDSHRQELEKKINNMTTKINTGKAKHDELTKEGNKLQKTLRVDESTIKKHREELENEKTIADKKKTAMNEEMAALEGEIGKFEGLLGERKATLEEMIPAFQDLETRYEARTGEYETKKKEIVTMKNQKHTLEENVTKTKKDIEQQVAPTGELRVELKAQRNASMGQLKANTSEVQDIEKIIYTVGCKLKAVMEENDRFQEANAKKTADIEDVKTQEVKNDEVKKKLEAEYATLRESLIKCWAEDFLQEQEFASRDGELVKDLSSLLERSQTREAKIGNITTELGSELVMLADFLDNVSRRRPKAPSAQWPTPPTTAKPTTSRNSNRSNEEENDEEDKNDDEGDDADDTNSKNNDDDDDDDDKDDDDDNVGIQETRSSSRNGVGDIKKEVYAKDLDGKVHHGSPDHSRVRSKAGSPYKEGEKYHRSPARDRSRKDRRQSPRASPARMSPKLLPKRE